MKRIDKLFLMLGISVALTFVAMFFMQAGLKQLTANKATKVNLQQMMPDYNKVATMRTVLFNAVAKGHSSIGSIRDVVGVNGILIQNLAYKNNIIFNGLEVVGASKSGDAISGGQKDMSATGGQLKVVMILFTTRFDTLSHLANFLNEIPVHAGGYVNSISIKNYDATVTVGFIGRS